MAAPSDSAQGPVGRVRAPRKADALPGELKPLQWHEGRGPITDEEALGVMRRRRRVELAGQPKTQGRRSGVPDELPPASSPKKASVFRFPARVMAHAHARAEMEGVPLTTILEEMLYGYVAGTPDSPESVRDRLAEKGIKWQRR